MMRFDPELWISGCGTIGAFGSGMPALATALLRGEPLTVPVDTSAGWHRIGGARSAARVPTLDLKEQVAPAAARRMSASSLWAVAAAKLAIADSECAGLASDGLPISVDLANVFGPSQYTEFLLRQVLAGDPQLASPFLFTDCVANAPAGQVAIALGARGSNTTWCERECGQILALLAAASPARDGRARRALCGVVDEMPPIVHAILDRLGALARPDADGRECARPFSTRSEGMIAGEGATVLLLEPASVARKRHARVMAGGRAFDPSAPPIGWGTGHAALAERIASDLDARGFRRTDVDAVVCAASGSVAGDRFEAYVLRALFGTRMPALLVPKASVGEFGGGVLASALLALRGAAFRAPTPEHEIVPELGAPLHQGSLAARRVLVLAFAAGGAAAWTLLQAHGEDGR